MMFIEGTSESGKGMTRAALSLGPPEFIPFRPAFSSDPPDMKKGAPQMQGASIVWSDCWLNNSEKHHAGAAAAGR
jgi:hypothetical protein